MSRDLIVKFAKHRGYCCMYAFFKTNKSKRTQALADELGVNRRSVQKWKAKLRSGKCDCEGNDQCQKRLIPILFPASSDR